MGFSMSDDIQRKGDSKLDNYVNDYSQFTKKVCRYVVNSNKPSFFAFASIPELSRLNLESDVIKG